MVEIWRVKNPKHTRTHFHIFNHFAKKKGIIIVIIRVRLLPLLPWSLTVRRMGPLAANGRWRWALFRLSLSLFYFRRSALAYILEHCLFFTIARAHTQDTETRERELSRSSRSCFLEIELSGLLRCFVGRHRRKIRSERKKTDLNPSTYLCLFSRCVPLSVCPCMCGEERAAGIFFAVYVNHTGNRLTQHNHSHEAVS